MDFYIQADSKKKQEVAESSLAVDTKRGGGVGESNSPAEGKRRGWGKQGKGSKQWDT